MNIGIGTEWREVDIEFLRDAQLGEADYYFHPDIIWRKKDQEELLTILTINI